MKILLAKQVLLPGKLIKHNCSSNNLKQGKILKHDKRVIGHHKFLSGEFPVLKKQAFGLSIISVNFKNPLANYVRKYTYFDKNEL